ncbi:glutamine-hydrolyzing carbamoyl-phosphate synthase small subunit [Candidatus Phycosocius spiralis]|uniref:Carbamoyl phosphate synthase small chain n=1 Tax=Candidatus Phycosocius spiralis TaxID=2815099 RepID=A0ABQ4PVN0_9PROT|nr:glutamine-hydrolyzing carbamoyl-phosphate synthase small subunit [Candidatus Phycosocius spiralis]GIU67032.1 carbamoyl-phosphate synthase small chain [Candidatus Phycosocius spiralis]
MTQAPHQAPAFARQKTAVLALADGTLFWGAGCGAIGEAVGEICFNTSMTGYQEILTDPSYAGQIVSFTAPHIGNTGTNKQDEEGSSPPAVQGARGAIMRSPPTRPSNWRSTLSFDAWLKQKNIVGLSGIDTRALTKSIRENGMPQGVIAHSPNGHFDLDALVAKANTWSGLIGLDLAKEVSCQQAYDFKGEDVVVTPELKVVVIDFGVKENILRCLGSSGVQVHVVPAQTSAEAILAKNPDGVLLSNGPGDPAATGLYATSTIQAIIAAGIPLLGICLGHQLLGLALGAKTIKMAQGHHGANHPVQDLSTKKVEIVSMNHGFALDKDSLPEGVIETHVSLFDGSNCGIALKDKPVFSVQYHPEASPGPKDSYYVFQRFIDAMSSSKQGG